MERTGKRVDIATLTRELEASYPHPWPGILARLIDREQGYVDRPTDRGGCTNWGITRPIFAADQGRPVTCQDIAALQPVDAAGVYWRQFVTAPELRLDQLPVASAVLELILDGAVVAGAGDSVRWLQQAINAERGAPSLAVDGALGPKTRAAAQACDTGRLVAGIIAARLDHHVEDVGRNPGQLVNLRGWVRRASGLLLTVR